MADDDSIEVHFSPPAGSHAELVVHPSRECIETSANSYRSMPLARVELIYRNKTIRPCKDCGGQPTDAADGERTVSTLYWETIRKAEGRAEPTPPDEGGE